MPPYSSCHCNLKTLTHSILSKNIVTFNCYHYYLCYVTYDSQRANDVEVKVQDDAFKDVDIGTDPLIITALVNNDVSILL